MQLFSQPFDGGLGDEIVSNLNGGKFSSLTIVVAFAKQSGVHRLKVAIDNFRRKKGKVRVFVGVDLAVTSYEALQTLFVLVDELWIVHTEATNQTFHPKVFWFQGDSESALVVGSNNLTGGGLWTNFESALKIDSSDQRASKLEIDSQLEQYVDHLTGYENLCIQVETTEFIEKLKEDGYVKSEIDQRILTGKRGFGNERKESLFKRHIDAPIPKVDRSHELVSGLTTQPSMHSHSDEKVGDVLWYSTQQLTGGSGNQIDLSKTSLIEKRAFQTLSGMAIDENYMPGTVEFFDIKAADTSEKRRITLHYEGVDYFENLIHYPQGSSRPNGTWRLQLQGKSASGDKMSSALKENGGIKRKIITFTKIDEDYFEFGVFSEDKLSSFKEASRTWGYNGRTKSARPIGFLPSEMLEFD